MLFAGRMLSFIFSRKKNCIIIFPDLDGVQVNLSYIQMNVLFKLQGNFNQDTLLDILLFYLMDFLNYEKKHLPTRLRLEVKIMLNKYTKTKIIILYQIFLFLLIFIWQLLYQKGRVQNPTPIKHLFKNHLKHWNQPNMSQLSRNVGTAVLGKEHPLPFALIRLNRFLGTQLNS